MLLQCTNTSSTSPTISLSDVSSIAQAIIALVNLFFVAYLIFYQRKKDKKDRFTQSKIQEQSIQLQWFKELIIQPHLSEIYKFYKDIHKIEEKLCISNLTDENRIEIVNYIKQEQSELRRTFIDAIKNIDATLYLAVKNNLDTLTDNLTENIFNYQLDFSDKAVYDTEIKTFITYSRNDLISRIFNYKGIPEVTL